MFVLHGKRNDTRLGEQSTKRNTSRKQHKSSSIFWKLLNRQGHANTLDQKNKNKISTALGAKHIVLRITKSMLIAEASRAEGPDNPRQIK